MDKQTLLIIDSQCENALIDKNFHDLNDTWMKEHQNLFDEIALIMKDNELKIYMEQHEDELSFLHLFLKYYLKDETKM